MRATSSAGRQQSRGIQLHLMPLPVVRLIHREGKGKVAKKYILARCWLTPRLWVKISDSHVRVPVRAS
ncbi:hypothetical protein EMEDMD4_90190 [Sinorhizobium medicae]|uniref:Uncharacterized protein n=1 Tax=Sinorhizobium medicae TaxID=110321 RepID=A0A508X7F2_9HYPH|nr:hypothetical protein EMEDMD4_90190 [Sinorhizobium medicae]